MLRKRTLSSFAAATAVLIIFAALPLTAQAVVDPFTVVALPDTQNYCDSAFGGTIYSSQTSWIVAHKGPTDQNIAFVTHQGDVTNGGTTAQYAYATAAMYQLDGQVPWGILPGNHDYGGIGNYTAVFGPSHFTGQTWYGGSYSQSSYQTFQAGGRNYLVLDIQYDGQGAEPTVRNWAQGVINAHPNWPTIISTHDYMTSGGRTGYGNTLFNGAIPAGPYAPKNDDGLVYGNKQVFMVLCGHMHLEYSPSQPGGPGAVLDKENKPVFELLADYQDYTNGGNGYLRLYQFDEDNSKIHVKSYSPYTGTFLTDTDSQFDISMNFTDRLGQVPEPSTVVLLLAGLAGLAAMAYRRRKK